MPTDRVVRRLQSSKGGRIASGDSKRVSSHAPAPSNMSEGEQVFAREGNKPLALYKKHAGELWKTYFTKDGDDIIDRDADISRNLIVGRMFTAPRQPAFLAYNSASDTNIALNSWVGIDFDTEAFDNNNNFASDTFTAPKSGLYLLSTNVTIQELDAAATLYRARINTSNRMYVSYIDPNYSADLNYYTFSITAVADMDKGDTASVEVYQTGGTQQTDVTGGAWLNTYFCGWFLG